MSSVRDKNIGWLRKRLYIPVTGMNGYSIDVLATGGQGALTALQINPDSAAAIIGKTTATNFNAVGATAATDKNARLRALGNGTPRIVPVEALNYQGLFVATAGDGVLFSGMVPYDIDPSMPVGVRPWWTSAAAAVGARTITFTVTYRVTDASAALADPTTALDTVITAQAPAGISQALQRGVRGVINANKVLPTTFFWAFKILMSAFDASLVENKYLLGLELDYIPRKTWGAGTYVDYGLPTSPFAIPQQV